MFTYCEILSYRLELFTHIVVILLCLPLLLHHHQRFAQYHHRSNLLGIWSLKTQQQCAQSRRKYKQRIQKCYLPICRAHRFSFEAEDTFFHEQIVLIKCLHPETFKTNCVCLLFKTVWDLVNKHTGQACLHSDQALSFCSIQPFSGLTHWIWASSTQECMAGFFFFF